MMMMTSFQSLITNSKSFRFMYFGLIIVFLSPFLQTCRAQFESSAIDCRSSPCVHGICLIDTSNAVQRFRCLCELGYTGSHCQLNYDECSLNLCRNNATCQDLIGDFRCHCLPGFTGAHCESIVDNCAANPCKNDGICLNLLNSYKCICQQGFLGRDCELDVNICSSVNCHNNGSCVEGVGLDYKCQCQPGFAGSHCEIKLDPCSTSPCQHGGRCVSDSPLHYACTCPCDWTGDHCEWKLENCTQEDDLNCMNDGVCRRISRFVNETVVDSSIPPTKKCYCSPGYTGARCERHFARCLQHLNLCENGGRCRETSNEYECVCPNKFEGKHCEIDCLRNDCSSFWKSSSNMVDIFPSTTVPLESFSISLDDGLSSLFDTTNSFTSLQSSSSPSTFTMAEPYTPSVITIDLMTPNLDSSSPTFALSSIEQPEPTPTFDFQSLSKSSDFPTESLDTSRNFEHQTVTLGPEPYDFSSTFILNQSKTASIEPEMSSISPDNTPSNIESRFQESSPSFTAFITTNTVGDQITTPQILSSQIRSDSQFQSSSSFHQIVPSVSTQSEVDLSLSPTSSSITMPASTSTTTADIIIPPTKNLFSARFLSDRNSRLLFIRNRFDSPHYFRLQFEFQTNQTDGVIFHARSETRPDLFAVLFMKAARLQYAFSCNTNQVVLMQSDRQLHSDHVHKLQIQFKLDLLKLSCFADLSLNDSEPVFASQSIDYSINQPGLCMKLFQFGRLLVEKDQDLPSLVGQLTPFNGCVRNIELNGRPRFVSSANLSQDLTECDLENICEQSPCRNGASCRSRKIQTERSLDSALYTDGKSFSLISWTCQCRPGYVGRLCELAVCEPNPCSDNSTCVLPSMYEYTCLCPRHLYGQNCQLDLRTDVPNFDDHLNSFMIYSLPNNNANYLEMRFNFTATTLYDQPMILMFMGQDYNQKPFRNDFLLLSINNEAVSLQINLGHGTKEISARFIRHELLHEVRFGHSQQYFWLSVDNYDRSEDRLHSDYETLNVEDRLFVAGHRYSDGLEQLKRLRFFSGCVFNITAKMGSFDNDFFPLDKVVFSHNVNRCEEVHCK